MAGDAEPLRRNRDFVILWLGETFSEAGTAMSALVFPLLGYAITRSPVAAGAVASVETVGRVVVRFVSGALVDRWSRRRVLVLANIAAAARLCRIRFTLFTSLSLGAPRPLLPNERECTHSPSPV